MFKEEFPKKGFVEGLLYGSPGYDNSDGSFLDTLKEESLKQTREDFEKINAKKESMENIVQITVKDEKLLKNGEFDYLIEKVKEANKTSLDGIELEFVVSNPWGSYTPTKDGFFIPPDRKPYEPGYVQVCGRLSRRAELEGLKNQILSSNPFEDKSALEVAKMFSELGEKSKYQTVADIEKEESKTTDDEEIRKAQTEYNILMNQITNMVTLEKSELVIDYLTKVVSKNLSSKKKAKVFRKIRKIYNY